MSPILPTFEGSIYKQMLRASAWTIVSRWSVRVIGLVNTAILARLLTPQDFGIMGMAMLMIGLIEGFLEFGSSMLIIREPNLSREYCDTAWTMQILQHLIIALIMLAIAPLAAQYFNEQRIVPVIQVLAASAVMAGMTNVGMVLVRKELDFAKDFRFIFYNRIFNFFVTVPLALVLLNYWALIVGHIVSTIISVFLSYQMHSYRPRLSLAKAKDFIYFGIIMIPVNIARYLVTKVPALVVGRITDTATFGKFNVVADLSVVITDEVIGPLGRALFPTYAKLVYDKHKLVEAYLNVLSSISIICIPIGFILSATAEDVILIILGTQWLDAVPILQWLAIYGAFKTLLRTLIGNILIITGHERLSALSVWIDLAILLFSTIIGGVFWGVFGVVCGATISIVPEIFLMMYIVTKGIPVTLTQLISAIWRSIIAGSLIFIVLIMRPDSLSLALLRLTVDIGIGFIVYTSALIGLWWLSGCPKGVEYGVIQLIKGRLVAKG